MRLFAAAAGASIALMTSAHAAPMTIGNVNFNSDKAASNVLWAQGGVFSGLTANLREACVDPTNPASTVGATGKSCRANEAAGFNLADSVEVDDSGPNPDDVLALFFTNPIVNGAGSCVASANPAVGPANAAAYAGCDLLVFEVLDQGDNPTLGLTLSAVDDGGGPLEATEILGVLLVEVLLDTDSDGFVDDEVRIFGFDLSGLGVAVGASAPNPLFLGNLLGSPDIAALVATTAAPPIPLPAAWPLFFAGLAGLSFASRRRRKI